MVLDVYNLLIAIICTYVKIADDVQETFYNYNDVHNLDICISCPCVQIYDDHLGYPSELPDIHTWYIETFVQYAKISDE